MASCVKNPVTGKRQFAVMSEEREVAMGTAYDPQIVAQFGLYQDSVLQAYIERKGREMALVSHRPNLEYHFRIMDSEVVNAFAVPGGFVYFTRGIMAHFNNEAEFMGVLGHEIGHITARHSVVQQRNATLAQLGMIAGMIARPELVQFMDPLGQGVQLMMLKFGRDAESQSDELGVEYSSKVGYDAHEMADFFETLARKSAEAGADQIPEFLSTHPNPLNRQANVQELASEWQTELDLNNPEVGRDEYLQMLEGLTYGEDPRQGFVENNVFYHPDLAFEMPIPANWRYQNSPSQFQMAPDAGDALMFLTLAEGDDLVMASQNTLQSYQLTSTSSDQRTLNGLSTLKVMAVQTPSDDPAEAQQQQQAEPIRVQMMFIDYNNLIYALIGVATESSFTSYRSSFDGTMEQFEVLEDQDKLSRQPERLVLRRTTEAGSFAQAMSSFGVPAARHEEWSVVNGMRVDDMVPAGTLLKISDAVTGQ